MEKYLPLIVAILVNLFYAYWFGLFTYLQQVGIFSFQKQELEFIQEDDLGLDTLETLPEQFVRSAIPGDILRPRTAAT